MQNKQGFTVLELMVGIVIFTLGFLGAYLLVNSASDASTRSRDEIIGANIMREQIELLKNLRDTNWIQFRSWNSIGLSKPITEWDEVFLTGSYYTIQNDFSPSKTIHTAKLANTFSSNKSAVLAAFQSTPSAIRLCTDSLGRYTHDCTLPNKKTPYASFLFIEQLITKNTSTNTPISVDRAYKVTVFFASFNKWYRLINMSTIITDWKNQ